MLSSSIRSSVSLVALLLVAAQVRADTLKVPSTDFPTIQSAVDVAGVGDTISIAKGVYTENVVVAKSSLTIKGGKTVVVNGAYGGNCITITGNDVTVQGITIANGGGPFVTDGGPTGGIAAVGTGITFSKLTVEACSAFGLSITGTGTIDGCTVDGCPNGPGIQVETDAPTGSTLTEITKNKVTHCGEGIVLTDGPFDVDKNTVEGSEDDGIVVILPALTADGSTLTQTLITSNTVTNNHDDGINVEQDNDVPNGVLIEKNKITDNEDGLVVSGFRADIESNTIQGNDDRGISLSASSCTLAKNKVTDNGGIGILVDAGGALVQDGTAGQGLNMLDTNTVQGSGGDAIDILSSNNSLTKNTVKDSLQDGIQVFNPATGNTLDGNKVNGCGHDGIDNDGQNTVISNNQSKSNGGKDVAGKGFGNGTVDAPSSTGNKIDDDSDLVTFLTLGSLELP